MQIHFFVPLSGTPSKEGGIIALVLLALTMICVFVLLSNPWIPACPYCGSNDAVIEARGGGVEFTSEGLIDKEATKKQEQYNKEHDRHRCLDCDKYFYAN